MPAKHTEVPTILRKVTQLTCNCCKKTTATDEDPLDTQEWLVKEWIGGYSSIFGDDLSMNLVLCQECTKRLLGHYVMDENGKYVL
jgi:hypothetical protein